MTSLLDKTIRLIKKIVDFLEPDAPTQAVSAQDAEARDIADRLAAKGWRVRDRRNP